MNLPSRCIGSTAWTIIKVGKERKGNFSSIESSSSTCFPAKQHLTFADSADCPQPPAPSRVTGLAAHVLAPTRDRTVSVLPTGPGCSSPAVQDASGQETRFCNHLSPQNLLSLVGTLEEPAEPFPASLHTKVSGRHSLGLPGEQKPLSPQNQGMFLPGCGMTLGKFGLGHTVIKKSSHPELGVTGGP